MLKTFTKFVDLIFENSCVICNESSGQNTICKLCESDFMIRNNHVKTFEEITVYSWGLYDGKLRNSIISLKAGKKKLTAYFAKRLVTFWDMLPQNITNKDYLVTPVPSHKQRIKERGFCQTTLIAKNFAEYYKFNLSTNSMIRKKETKFMNSLANLKERTKNINDAFEIINPINAKNILVVDDILTSGSTLCEIARTIHRHNPNANITGLTVAAGDRYS